MCTIVTRIIKGTNDKYSIRSDGLIFSHVSNKILKYREDRDGYYRTNIYNSDGKLITVRAHTLVATHFISTVDIKGKVVNHIDFNRKNNNVDNLEWVTVLDNHKHSAEAGRTLMPKATPVQVNGNSYVSLSQASKQEKIPLTTLFNKLRKGNIDGIKYI